MPDFNQVLTPGDYQNGQLNVVVEIPQGSNLKIEWDREHVAFKLDRIEPLIFAKPINYGFIPQTLDEDGDELDALIFSEQSLTTGIWLEATIVGVMKFVDDGEVDDKIVVKVTDDRQLGSWPTSLEDLGEPWKKRIEHHFTHYKDLKKPGSTQVTGWGDIEEAKKIIADSITRYNQQ